MRVLARAAARTLIISVLALLLVTGLAWADADPTGAKTGSAADVAAETLGSPTADEIAQDLGHLKVGTNMFFVIVGVALIFFMQAGFMLVETGFCRAKNAAHVAMTNFVIFAVGALAYWAFGFGLQFGGFGALGTMGGSGVLDSSFSLGDGLGLFGLKGFFLQSGGTYDVAVYAFFLFQLVFMDTAATIVTGGMAERWKFSAFVPFGAFMGLLVYPLYGMWVWGGGWLSQLGKTLGLGHGVLDFAGSSVVHAVGGFAALAGAMVIGPRLGKFKDGKPVAIPGHHIPMAILGTIILVFGWMGFNGMSTLSAGDLRFPVIITNTMLAGAAGCLGAMFLVWRLWGHPDPSMTANGMLAGLVAITAPCAFVSTTGAVVIGLLAGFLVVGSVVFVERVLKVDDPVGAVSVHGVNGAWGMVALGLFADGTYGAGFNGVAEPVRGLFYGGGYGQLAAQLISVIVVFIWSFGLHWVFFRVQHAVWGIRSSAEDELAGLDVSEMGILAYPEFSETGIGSFEAPSGIAPLSSGRPHASPSGTGASVGA